MLLFFLLLFLVQLSKVHGIDTYILLTPTYHECRFFFTTKICFYHKMRTMFLIILYHSIMIQTLDPQFVKCVLTCIGQNIARIYEWNILLGTNKTRQNDFILLHEYNPTSVKVKHIITITNERIYITKNVSS